VQKNKRYNPTICFNQTWHLHSS